MGKWVAFGVLSRGGVSTDGTTCEQPIYTRFDAWGSLIVGAAQQAATDAAARGAAYPLAVWAGGTGDSGRRRARDHRRRPAAGSARQHAVRATAARGAAARARAAATSDHGQRSRKSGCVDGPGRAARRPIARSPCSGWGSPRRRPSTARALSAFSGRRRSMAAAQLAPGVSRAAASVGMRTPPAARKPLGTTMPFQSWRARTGFAELKSLTMHPSPCGKRGPESRPARPLRRPARARLRRDVAGRARWRLTWILPIHFLIVGLLVLRGESTPRAIIQGIVRRHHRRRSSSPAASPTAAALVNGSFICSGSSATSCSARPPAASRARCS